MRSIIKKTVVGLYFALLIAMFADIVAEIKLNPLPLFALLVLLTAVTMIKNQWIVFVLTTVVSAGVSYYDINFAIYCLPAVMLVWSAQLCKTDKATPVFTAIVQLGFAASLYFSYINKDMETDLSRIFVSMNKFVLIPIVVIAFVILQNHKTESYEDDDEEDED
ncbi:MAG: hypothetical protein IJS17_05290 [Clostridia bacterium]|nr:hypothetical protein [Clostridia bacterium]